MITAKPRIFVAGVFASLAVAVSGCGGAGTSGASTESGASLVTARTLAFVSVDSDLDSSQWQKVDDLSQKFPGRDKAVTQLEQSLAKENLDWERDIDPALGPEVDLAVVRGPTLDATAIAFLTKPDDPDKFRQLVRKLDATDESDPSQTPVREVDGWYVAAENDAAIDRVLKGDGEALSDNATYEEALGKLPDDAIAKAYVNGEQVAGLLRDVAQEDPTGFDPSAIGIAKVDYIAASLGAEDEGVRLKGVVTGPGAETLGTGDYASKLIEGVPGDALAFLTFRGGGLIDQLDKLRSNPAFAVGLGQVEEALGVSFDDLLALFTNEVAFYTRPGAAIPEFTLLLDPEDRDRALATLDKLAARIALMTPGRVSSGTQAGHEVKTIDFGPVAVHWAALDGTIMITNGVTGIADYGSGQKLTESASFKEAKAASGLPDSTGGFVYVDLKAGISLVESLAGLAGEALPQEVTANLEPLRALVAWTAGSGDTRTFDVFLQVE